MDERTFATAQVETERQRDLAIEHCRSDTKTYSVIVLGWNGDQPLNPPIKATNADERSKAMVERGINLRKDDWAVGYVDNRRVHQIAGNNDEAKRLIAEHLRRR